MATRSRPAAAARPLPSKAPRGSTPPSLDIVRLEVRVDNAPRSVRIAATRETTLYQRARIGEVEFVVPAMSELMLRDRDGSEMLNRSRFDRYRRYTGSSTVSYGPAGDTPPPSVPTPAARRAPQVGKQLTASLDTAIPEDAAIGDAFTATTAAGEHLTGRITNLRRAGKSWMVDLTLSNMVRRSLLLPLKVTTKLTWKID